MKNRLATAAVGVALLAAMTGCASTPGAASAEKTGSNRPAATSDTATTTEDTSTQDATPADEATTTASDGPVKFGETWEWEDNLSLTVSKPKPYTPSESAAADKHAKHFVQFTVTVVNKTGKTFDPALFNASLQSANEEGDQVFDSENNIGGGPSTKLLSGREAKFKVAYAAADPKDLVLEVHPDFEHEAIYSTS